MKINLISCGFIFLLSCISGEIRAELSGDNMKDCSVIMVTLEERFYSALNKPVNDGSELNEAGDLLQKASPCVKEKEQKALFADLKGVGQHLAFKYSKDRKYFDLAKKSFESAIALGSRDEQAYMHLSQLMRTDGNDEMAVQYINKVLTMEPQPKDPLPYLQVAYQLAVDMSDWESVKTLYKAIMKRDPQFYRDPGLLLSTVKFLCHLGHIDDANKIIEQNENYMKDTNMDGLDGWHQLLKSSREVVAKCPKAGISA